MNATQIALILTLIVMAAGIAALFYTRRKRSQGLQTKFGPEYARAVEDKGGAGKAESALQQREARVKSFDLQPLSAHDQRRFGLEWDKIQALFVDDPTDATAKADDVLGQVMSARGYPDGPFEQRLEDLSVEHAEAVQGYRAAHEVALKRARGEANTEDMRQAMINYRKLFDELVGAKATDEPEKSSLRLAS